MSSPSRFFPSLSPPRSTPCLDYDYVDHYESPPDDYLATPDMSEWREIRRLEDEKMRKDEDSLLETSFQYELPSLDVLSQNQRPLLSELPPQLPPWPHSTISPKDAFPDYQEVRKFLQEQARSVSPTTFSIFSSPSPSPYISQKDIYNELVHLNNDQSTSHASPSEAQPTPSTPALSPARLLASPPPLRRVGKKVKRGEDSDYAPAPKRRIPPSHSVKSKRRPLSPFDDDKDDDDDDDDDDVADFDDESGDFRPARRLLQSRRRVPSGPRSSARPTIARPRTTVVRRIAPHPKSKSNRGEDYQEGPCECQNDNCTNCQMTCFYTFVHGPRKGEVCKRLFESGRHLDLKRHKATHAVQEWKWLQDGEITSDVAHWYSVVFEGKEHGLMCPNGDCTTTFTRYDALKRHMERGTCQYANLESIKDGLDNRQIKARVIRESDDKYERVAAARATDAKHV